MNFIELSQNDSIPTIAKKMNMNMRRIFGISAKDKQEVTVLSDEINDVDDRIDNLDYASSPSHAGNADKSNAMLFGSVDPTSIATAFTVTVPGLTELVNGTCIYIRNHVVTSASGFTIDVNGLGAKPCYNNMTNATQDTTIFNVSYSMIFIYDSSLDSGNGGWWIYRGYNSDNNTIGYQLRTNNSTLPASDKFYRYRLLFTSADGQKWVPANKSTSTNATASRTPNTRAIDPFGPIVYYGSTTIVSADANVSVTSIWQQYTFALGYSFNDTGASLTMTAHRPVYLRCSPNADGSVQMEGITQTLPTSMDGKVYILLGRAYTATNIELLANHPVYYHDGSGIITWTGLPQMVSNEVATQIAAANIPSQVADAIDQTLNVTMTSTLSDFFTEDSCTVTACNAMRWGNIAFIRFSYRLNSALTVPSNGDITDVTLGKLKIGWRPFDMTNVILDQTRILIGDVDSSGDVKARSANSRGTSYTIDANAVLYASMMFVIGIQ